MDTIPNKTFFIFLRHGQGTHNIDFEKYGEHAYFDNKNIDAKLTETGKDQAANIFRNNLLNKDKYDVIYCSPLTRCIETLMLAFPDSLKTEVFVDDRLMEPQGDCACNLRPEYDELKKKLPEKWNLDGVGFTNPFSYLNEGYQLGLNGNSVFLERIKKIGEDILNKYQGKRILICTHHDWIRGWFQLFQDGKIISPKNCEILKAEV